MRSGVLEDTDVRPHVLRSAALDETVTRSQSPSRQAHQHLDIPSMRAFPERDE